MGASSPPVLDAARSDGYYDGNIAIQGVRAFDPNMNQWTTPDAYAGDVHDPMSQHPYMWNNNNPVQYADPSGYCSIAQPMDCTASVLSALGKVGASLGVVAEVAAKASPVVNTLAIVLTPAALANDSEHADEKETRGTDASELEGHGIDALEVKQDALGKKAEISKADIRIDKKSGELVVFRKGAKTGVKTGVFLTQKPTGPPQ